jgi:hypothetical protein
MFDYLAGTPVRVVRLVLNINVLVLKVIIINGEK